MSELAPGASPLPNEKPINPSEMAEAALLHMGAIEGSLTFKQSAGVLRYLHDAARGRSQYINHDLYGVALGEVASMTGNPLLIDAYTVHNKKYGPRNNDV